MKNKILKMLAIGLALTSIVSCEDWKPASPICDIISLLNLMALYRTAQLSLTNVWPVVVSPVS